jgi:hypothetical protein
MTQGLYPRLALAAALLMSLPACVLAADETESAESDSPRIFEEFSLTSATTEQPVAPPSISTPSSSPCIGSAPCVSPQGCCSPVGCGQSGCCDSCGTPCLFYANVDALFLHTQVHGMDASAGVTTGASGFGFQNGDAFDKWTFAPRLVAGVQDNCWGFEGRFFYLSDSTSSFGPFFPVPGGNGLGDSTMDRLKAYTIDWEVTRALCLGTSKVDLFFGGRYASFESDQGINVTRQTAADQISYASVFNDFDFNGIGVTMGFQGRTPIGCDTCISAVWGLRGSVMWGDANRGVMSNGTVVTEDGAAGSEAVSAYASNSETAFIIEALLGLQWDHELKCLPMSAYLRVAAEYQYWDLGSRGGADAIATAPTGGSTPTAAGTIDGRVDANFIGLSVGCGFNW